MSYNRVVTEETLELFHASERGDAKAVAELARNANTDINWHRSQSVRAIPKQFCNRMKRVFVYVPVLCTPVIACFA